MGIFDRFKKNTPAPENDSTNLIYELLFCDNIELYRNPTQGNDYPWMILFAENPATEDLIRIVNDENAETRVKVLAANILHAKGQTLEPKKLFAVIVEVGLDEGLDVLASFADGTARYINYTGRILVWETTDETSNALTSDLFRESTHIVNKIGPWNQPRKPRPPKGNTRISFLVSDGLYFGEGPIQVLFNDPMAQPAFTAATSLMQYLTSKAV
ncbi:hypothetical protein [Flavobacterium sp.]|uniref:hypothetical protein n=1 Tax=Flavobacterium sp. TaxID=239 RepID=UPI0039E2947A